MIKSAFTMIELIFAIVIIGILAAIAVPKLMVTRDDAIYVKGKSQLSSIKSGITMQKSKNMLRGITNSGSYYPTKLDNYYPTEQQYLFYFGDGNSSNILESPIYPKKSQGYWWESNSTTYHYFVSDDKNVTFTYNPQTGSFDCDHTQQECKNLAE